MKLPNPHIVEVFVKDRGLDNLKILHLSDLHIGKKVSQSSMYELVNICDTVECDFVIITGDILDTKVDNIADKLMILNSIKKTVYYVSGNHDLFHGLEDLKQKLDNFIFMDNNYSTFEFSKTKIHIVGLPDRMAKFFSRKRETQKLLDYTHGKNNIIFLAHQPKDYKLAIQAKSALFLCGHTHGGQIFPFHYLVRLEQPFLDGVHYVKKMAIYVSRGMGTWGLPYRFKAPSEITIVKLIANDV